MGNESKIQTSSDFMLHSQNVSVVPTVVRGGGEARDFYGGQMPPYNSLNAVQILVKKIAPMKIFSQ